MQLGACEIGTGSYFEKGFTPTRSGYRDPVRELEGEWNIERLGGLLPPMVGIRKRIHGARGETRFVTLPLWPFRIERRTGRVALVYRPPFSTLVDELRPEVGGSWVGRTVIGGLELGRFRMIRKNQRA